jgi:outer membrane protein assembly factor BamB
MTFQSSSRRPITPLARRAALRAVAAWILLLAAVGRFAIAGPLPWPDKSGPTHNGHADPAEAEGLPTTWDEAAGKNIVWKVPLEHAGHSTPVIGEGRVWVTAATDDGTKQYVTALDAASGKVLHQKLLFENVEPEPLGNEINNYAAPSCVLEEGAVYVHFGTYGTARLDPQTAEVVWQRRDINVRHFRGPGSSPVLFEDLLILTFDGIDQQFLVALNKATGETVWQTPRSTNYGDLDEHGLPKREGDLRKAYGTPLLVKVDDRWQVVSVGSRAAFGYDARTGEEIWTVTHDDFNASARPAFVDGIIVLHTGGRSANLLGVRLDGTTKGNVDKTHIVWNRDRGNSDLASPLAVGDRVFMVSATGVGICLNAKTGEEVWQDRIGGTHMASPVFANGLIYCFSQEGVATAVRAADTFEIVSTGTLAEGMTANPAIAGGAFYLRTTGHLYKVAQK